MVKPIMQCGIGVDYFHKRDPILEGFQNTDLETSLSSIGSTNLLYLLRYHIRKTTQDKHKL